MGETRGSTGADVVRGMVVVARWIGFRGFGRLVCVVEVGGGAEPLVQEGSISVPCFEDPFPMFLEGFRHVFWCGGKIPSRFLDGPDTCSSARHEPFEFGCELLLAL